MFTQRNRNGLKVAAILAGSAAALSLAGCASGDTGDSDEPIELRMTWWGDDSRHEVTNAALDRFEELNPGITVVRDFSGFDGYLDKITTQYTGGNSPDVIQLYNEVLVEFASRGQLVDLGEQVDAGNLSLDGWPEDLLEVSTIDGALSALPFGLSTHGFIFDNTALEDLGVEPLTEGYTWDDLADFAADVSEASDGSLAGVTDLSGGYQVFEVWAKQHGEEFLDADGIGFSASTLESFWDYWAELRESGGATAPDVTSEYQATPYDAVIAGVAASTFLFTNQYDGVQERTPNVLSLERMPGEAGQPGQYLRTAMNLTVSAQSEHPEAAAKLVDFLVNNEEANSILGLNRGFPANANVIDAASEGANENVQRAIAIFESVREHGSPAPVPAPAGSGTVNALFQEVAQQVQFGQLSVADAVEQFMSQAASELG
ncbi:ABC transporter substrate-binding protein [Homoserinibacter sp. GY 40078]|uniref:ABC transporter substrate-binding protein n=1 Tax=Homoserinibacter sp. GY 40078 TaxID=2603275 RepID=UPI0011C72C3B|nr:extracellular solute-binding protein [Homoserinibacter sp. GY 40078]TXK18633.1 extracellular solute-binding protein [Homoserinibacter sp. GY 40078]